MHIISFTALLCHLYTGKTQFNSKLALYNVY